MHEQRPKIRLKRAGFSGTRLYKLHFHVKEPNQNKHYSLTFPLWGQNVSSAKTSDMCKMPTDNLTKTPIRGSAGSEGISKHVPTWQFRAQRQAVASFAKVSKMLRKKIRNMILTKYDHFIRQF